MNLKRSLHIWLAGLFITLFAFRETRSRAGAAVAAIGFGLGGFLVGYPVLQLAVLETVTWLPLVLLCLHGLTETADSRSRQRWGVAAAVALALACTAGHPQTFLYVAYLCAAYFLWRSHQAAWTWRRRLIFGALIMVLAAALSSPTWLPAARYALRSSRASATYDFVSSGVPLLDFFQVGLPNTLSLWVPQYAGMAVLLLAVIALYQGGGPVRFWSAGALLFGWLALGDQGILFELAYRILPGASLFRQQERWLSVFNFALVMLAAHGASFLPRLATRTLVRALITVGAFLGVGILVLAAGPALRPEGWVTIVGRQVMLAALAALLLWVIRGRPQAWLLLLCLLAADLFLATGPGLGREPGAADAFWPDAPWIAALRAADSRLDTSNVFWSNFGEIYGLSDLAGISPLKPEGLAQFERLPAGRRWALMGITHVVTGALPPGVEGHAVQLVDNLKPGDPGPVGMLFALDNPSPAARLVFDVVVEPDREAAIALLGGDAFDPSRQVVLAEAVALPAAAPEGAAGVQITSERPGRLTVVVDTPADGVLVLNRWFYPGWRVVVNGDAAPLLAANHYLQGVHVPAGRSNVTFSFRPLDLYAAGGASLFALLVAVALLVAPLSERRLARFAPTWKAPRTGARPPMPGLPGLTQLYRTGRSRLGALDVRIYLVATLLLAFTLRLHTAAAQDLRGDEAFSIAVTNEPLEDIVRTLILTNDPHPPLHYFLLDGWRTLVGQSELALRLSSILLSLLLLALTARIGFDLAGRGVGVLATLLLAVSQSQVWMGHDVRNQYLLALCFGLLATLLLWRRRSWWLYGVAAALTVYSHYFGIFLLLAHGVFLLRTRRADFWRWAAAGGAAALLFLPWLFVMLDNTIATQLSDPARLDLGEHVLRVGTELVVGSAWPARGARWVFLIALGLAFWGARHWPGSGQGRRRGVGFWLFTWLGITTLGLFLIRLNRSIYNDFYAVLAAPAWWLLIGAGVVSLWQGAGLPPGTSRGADIRRWARPLLGVGALLLFLTTNALSLRNYYADTVTYGRDRGYKDVAATLAAAAGPDDLILYHAPDPSLAYYLRDLPMDRDLQPPSFGMDEAGINLAVAQSVAPYPRVWFIPAESGVMDPTNAVTRWLDYHLLHEQYYRFGSLALRAYRPVSSAGAVADPLDVRWVNALDLRGVYVTRNGAPVSFDAPLDLQPGDELAVTLLWNAHDTVAQDYVVFVHLLGEAGQLIAQHDGVPLLGTRPTSSWQRGEQLLDRHVLTIGDPGRKRPRA